LATTQAIESAGPKRSICIVVYCILNEFCVRGGQRNDIVVKGNHVRWIQYA